MSINLPLAIAMIVSGTMVGGAIVLAITTVYAQTPSDPWQRFKQEAPAGKVEVRLQPAVMWWPYNSDRPNSGERMSPSTGSQIPDGWPR